ncbi:hypothetical protein TrST_g1177 [Triparma strigata]|uniref:Strictosidine synthase conserved region domain-containing protein n=1 Tax=Triparma strigata TaxID=1606541 RepID=A0A9W7EJC4_9STRA|nr:hypothetical protein TrST_g1177 [Triparma strigata]
MNWIALFFSILFAIAYTSTAPDAVNVSEWPTFSLPINPKPLTNVKKYALNNVHAPETNIITPNHFYSLTEDGAIKEINDLGQSKTVCTVGGRPLGGAYAPLESTSTTTILYVAEITKGLLRVTLSHLPSTPPIITLVSFLNPLTNLPILYADDVTISSKGIVYFTDASNLPVPLLPGSVFKRDTLGTSIKDGIRGLKSGCILSYDPFKKATRVVKQGIWFANGIAVEGGGKYLLVCETFGARVLKVSIEEDTFGETEVFAEGVFPGYVDGLSFGEGGKVHVAVPSPAPKAVVLLSKIKPIWLNTLLRSFILTLPPLIKEVPYGCFVTLSEKGEVIETRVDYKGEEANFITSVEERDGKIYLGSLKTNFIGVVDA